jgi:predicted HicB family RNase H-like nuclease
MSVMTYRGYAARVEFDADDRIFVGHVAGIRDVVGFHGASVDELEAAFREAVDDYLQACEKLGQAPAKPFSGRVMFRIDPQVHARSALAAQLAGLSLNEWGERALSQAAEQATSRS